MKDNKFIFIPSVSAGYLMAGITGNKTFQNEMSYDYYNYDNEFRYPYFLITAGHFYKKDVFEKCNFFKTPGVEIFGDSGGFQIATGTLKWNKDIRHDIMTWLERNSTIAANLDIPPRSKLFGETEAREISYDNFKYFHENQSGGTKFLNVLQGKDLLTYTSWYNMVSSFTDFKGWCIGNCTLFNIVTSFYVLLRNKEHLRSNVFHFLGTSSPAAFVFMSHMQNALNQIGVNVQIYSDSSSPNSARFGNYYTDINYKTLSWNSLHVPYLRTDVIDDLDKYKAEIFTSDSTSVMPLFNKFDKELFTQLFNHQDVIDYNSRFCAALILRNIYAYKYQVEQINQLTLSPEYYRISIFGEAIAKLGTMINEMVKFSDSITKLDSIYNRYLPILNSYNKSATGETIQHSFF